MKLPTAQRVLHFARLGPKVDRAVFDAMLAHGLKAAVHANTPWSPSSLSS